MRDLENPDEIAQLVRAFYARVREDNLLGPVFNTQAKIDWDEHENKLTAFWCKLELNISGFQGAPTKKHAALSEKQPFTRAHFSRWVALFHSTVDAQWRGPHAQSIKERAVKIAEVQSKIVPRAEQWTRGHAAQ